MIFKSIDVKEGKVKENNPRGAGEIMKLERAIRPKIMKKKKGMKIITFHDQESLSSLSTIIRVQYSLFNYCDINYVNMLA